MPRVFGNLGEDVHPKLLLIGDSLTAGFTGGGFKPFVPYGWFLSEELKDMSAQVVVNGICAGTAQEWAAKTASPLIQTPIYGWIASGEGMEHIMQRLGFDRRDLVLIMGGTNDITYGSQAAPILASLKTLHAAAHGRGVKTLAISIPPTGSDIAAQRASIQGEVNNGLGAWCGGEPMCAGFFDTSFLDPDAPSYRDDGLHFSPAGYEDLGRKLAGLVRQALA